MTALTQEIVRSIWDYDQDTGYFYWKIKPRYRIEIGSRAGFYDTGIGYWRLRYKGKSYKASRVAWLYVTGVWPKNQIDHKNLKKTDDRFSNLRDATNAENCMNKGLRCDNKTGSKGVFKRNGVFIASIMANGSGISKSFKSQQEAENFYKQEAIKRHGDFVRM